MPIPHPIERRRYGALQAQIFENSAFNDPPADFTTDRLIQMVELMRPAAASKLARDILQR